MFLICGLSIASTTDLLGGNSGLTERNGRSIPGGINSSTFPAAPPVAFAPVAAGPTTAPICSAVSLTPVFVSISIKPRRSLSSLVAAPPAATPKPTGSASDIPASAAQIMTSFPHNTGLAAQVAAPLVASCPSKAIASGARAIIPAAAKNFTALAGSPFGRWSRTARVLALVESAMENGDRPRFQSAI
ncbi:hypothetical protein PS655_06024 [Pseudomonas fluorescens]|uniref:Uncharacterized protein n=1 Tax=Pseudomonas fluorescens TaxID=294 RepID=A0A5E6Y340_PSEFL|nr:hypothetical protein PS655_06024 [Pseudomonas fluorescens]